MLTRSAFRPRHKNAPRPAEKSCRSYLAWLRGRPCFAEFAGDCAGKIEAAHTYGAGDKGMGSKSSDRFAIPLCSKHHADQHRMGWKSFEAEHGFDAPKTAARYFDAWPGKMSWLAKLEAAK